jgi:hypothetical protein
MRKALQVPRMSRAIEFSLRVLASENSKQKRQYRRRRWAIHLRRVLRRHVSSGFSFDMRQIKNAKEVERLGFDRAGKQAAVSGGFLYTTGTTNKQ